MQHKSNNWKKLLRNEQEIADRVALFFETQLTIDKCRNYISRVNQVNYLKRLDKNNLVIFNIGVGDDFMEISKNTMRFATNSMSL